MPLPNGLHTEEALRELHRAIGCAVYTLLLLAAGASAIVVLVLWWLT